MGSEQAVPGHGDGVELNVFVQNGYIRTTENSPMWKDVENCIFALISLIACAEMWLIISGFNGETQTIMLLFQGKALNRRKVALEVNIFLCLSCISLNYPVSLLSCLWGRSQTRWIKAIFLHPALFKMLFSY